MSYRPVSKTLLNVLPWTLLACVFLASCGSGSTTDQGSASVAGGTMAAPSITPPPVITATQITAFVASGSNTKVTSPNGLSSGDVVVITGTTNYNGTFSVVSATASDFLINTAFVANDGTGYWQPGGGLIAGCSTSGDTNFISLAGVPSRVSGVAPLAVFFDATSTSATTTAHPFHELNYQWNFGDPASGNWTYGSGAGSNSRNLAYGPVAAHVFDNAGTYLINLAVTDGTHTVLNQCLRIAVQDPPVVYAGTKTTCVSSSSMPSSGFDGCPSGAAVAQQSNMATAVSTYCTVDGRRLLFKHDDSFTGSPTIAHGCQIGMYGSGAKPALSGGFKVTGSDARIISIATSGSSSNTVTIGSNTPTVTNTLIYKNTFGSASGYGFIDNSINNAPDTGLFIVDNQCNQCFSSEGTYLGMQYGAFMGNLSTACSGCLHNIRMMYSAYNTINNNTFNGTGNSGYETIGIRSMDQPYDTHSDGFSWSVSPGPGVPDTAYNVVSDNDIYKSNGFVSLMPEQYYSDSTNRDIIIERNYFHASGGSISQPLYVRMTKNFTIRDNVFDTSGYNDGNSITITSLSGAVSDGWVYNNTAYSSSSNGISMSIGSGSVSNVAFANNLGYWAGHSGALVSTGGCSSGCTASNNSTNVGTNPSFVGPLTSISGFKPNTGSYAIGAGTSVPVWADFFNLAIPSPRDIGAVNH